MYIRSSYHGVEQQKDMHVPFPFFLKSNDIPILKSQNYETEKSADLKVEYSSVFVVLNKMCIVQLDTYRKFR
uniref:Uncharacterized protein n=1 Tax=Arundo donax TaxID=35708 RepID=A0A0A9ASQ8_ARUDO